MEELQIDSMALQRGMLVEENARIHCEKERAENNTQLIRRIVGGWEIFRTGAADTREKPPIDYREWTSIEGKLGELTTAEQVGDFRRYLWEERSIEENGNVYKS